MIHTPIPGPATGSEEWLEVHYSAVPGIGCITASQAAAAIGEGEFQQPFDIYGVHTGILEPWEGNEMASRGQRFEPFIAGEYSEQTGNDVEVGQPLFRHPEHDFLGCTPDGMLTPKHGVEFKACNYRRAKDLGEQHSDDVFSDWLAQIQHSIGVMGVEQWDLFVMIDLHNYKLFHIERNDRLIDAMFEKEAELWERIQRRDPPDIDTDHRRAGELVKRLYGGGDGSVVDLSDRGVRLWGDIEELRAQDKVTKSLIEKTRAQIEIEMGEATIARLPGGEREVCRIAIADSVWSQKHIDEAENMQGKVKRKSHVRLQARKVKV